MPRKFRDELDTSGEIVLSRGLDGCIWGFVKSAWEKEAEKQLEVSVTEERGRNLRRYLFSAAEVVKLDKQGRFIIPGNLLGYARLRSKVVVVGAGDHFEIWNPKLWKKMLNDIAAREVR